MSSHPRSSRVSVMCFILEFILLILISTKSNDGSASESGESFASTPTSFRRTGTEAFAALTGGPQLLTKANLERINSIWENEIRLNEAPTKVEQIKAAAAPLGFELPAKAEQQLLEDHSGVEPMRRFIKGTEDIGGGAVDAEFWNELTMTDPLAAELDAICRVTAQAAA